MLFEGIIVMLLSFCNRLIIRGDHSMEFSIGLVPHLLNYPFCRSDPVGLMRPSLLEPSPSVCRMECESSIIYRCIVENSVVFLQFLPGHIYANPELFGVRKVLCHLLIFLKLAKQEFKPIDHIPNVSI